MKKKIIILTGIILLVALAAGGFLYLYFTRCPKPQVKAQQTSSALTTFPSNSGCCTSN